MSEISNLYSAGHGSHDTMWPQISMALLARGAMIFLIGMAGCVEDGESVAAWETDHSTDTEETAAPFGETQYDESETGPDEGSVQDGDLSDAWPLPGETSYEIIGGRVIIEGDIDIGPASMLPEDGVLPATGKVAREGTGLPWPDRIIPYRFSPNMPQLRKDRLFTALARWNNGLPESMKITMRPYVAGTQACTVQNCPQGTWCRFGKCSPDEHMVDISMSDELYLSSSTIGARSPTLPGENYSVMKLGYHGTSSSGNIGVYAHELGHLLGLRHEQTRADRDAWVSVHPECIEPGHEHNFAVRLDRFTEGGPYDFNSLMGYESCAFSIDSALLCSNNNCPTMTKLDGSKFGENRGDPTSNDLLAVMRREPGSQWHDDYASDGAAMGAGVALGQFGPGLWPYALVGSPGNRWPAGWACLTQSCLSNPTSNCPAGCSYRPGRAHTYLVTERDGVSPFENAQFGVVHEGAKFGSVIRSVYLFERIQDSDYDIVADLLVGAPEHPGTSTIRSGAVKVYAGTQSDGPLYVHQLSQDVGAGLPSTQTYEEGGDLYGSSIAIGTGFPEPAIAIGAPHSSVYSKAKNGNSPGFWAGAVYLYQSANLDYAGSENLTSNPVRFRQRLTMLDFGYVPTNGDDFGHSLAWGDYNGDGKRDLAVGAPGWASDSGAVFIYYGTSSSAVSLVAGPVLLDAGDVALGDKFGWALAAADLIKDTTASQFQRSELIVGHPGESIPGASGSGRVSYYKGTTSGLVFHKFIEQPSAREPGDEFGYALAVIDGNGDSDLDLAVGAPGENVRTIVDAGRVFVMPGPGFSSGTNFGGGGMRGEQVGARLGSVLEYSADWNYLFIQAPGVMSLTKEFSTIGAAYVYRTPGLYPVQYLIPEPTNADSYKQQPGQCRPTEAGSGFYREINDAVCGANRTCRPAPRYMDVASGQVPYSSEYEPICSTWWTSAGPGAACQEPVDCGQGQICYSGACRTTCEAPGTAARPRLPNGGCPSGECIPISGHDSFMDFPIGICPL